MSDILQELAIEHDHINDLTGPGDYCIVTSPSGKCVVLMCPVLNCFMVMGCRNQIITERPLTLSPSVVGPSGTIVGTDMAIHGPCLHHFMIEDGKYKMC